MPKKLLTATTLEDAPTWNALVAELGDPRPYEPGCPDVVTVTVTDEPCVDAPEFDAARDDLDRTVDDLLSDLDDLGDDARGALDAVFPLDRVPPRLLDPELTAELPVVTV